MNTCKTVVVYITCVYHLATALLKLKEHGVAVGEARHLDIV